MEETRKRFFEMVYEANTLRHKCKETFNDGVRNKEKGDVIGYQIAMKKAKALLDNSDTIIGKAKKLGKILCIEITFDWALYAYVIGEKQMEVAK